MRAFFLLLGLVSVCSGGERHKLIRPTTYEGMADASGAVALTTNLFAVADDEDNVLRIYRAEQGGLPVREVNCEPFLSLVGDHLEADLEAGARIGNRAYWIGSHGRNKKGKDRPNRGCFFATELTTQNDEVSLTPIGHPYKSLLADLLSDPRLSRFGLVQASQRAPKEQGALNIEGLSATPDDHLLLGFRNPIPEGKALLVPLLNPKEMIEGNRARLGDPILLDLGGLGIRDISWYQDTYVIIGGPYHGGTGFQLFKWKGGSAVPEALQLKHLNRYHPEALVIYPDKGLKEFQILSDDGTEPVEGVPGKQVTDKSKKSFRSFWVTEGKGRGD